MVDLHCHILPAIDDGARSTGESIEMARIAVEDGVRVMVATPHLDHCHGVDAGEIRARVDQLAAALAGASVQLEVRAAAEIAIARLGDLGADELRAACLGDSSSVLLECPLEPGLLPDTVRAAARELAVAGHRVVLAHPERSPVFHRRPELLRELVDGGACASLTAGSFLGQFARPTQQLAWNMLRDGVVHNVASDAHDTLHRAPRLSPALDAIAYTLPAGTDDPRASLARDIPQALLTEATLPSPPRFGLQEKRWRRRLWGSRPDSRPDGRA